ncbi:MAG TPA: ABC transporter substrate-binding protein, partial [Candidatus Binatia bacterium]
MELKFPLMRYDIVQPLLDGRVKVEGADIKPFKTSSMVFADVPQLRTGDFDLWELNWGYFLPAIEAGWELIGLPIFPKRKPAYQYIFCRTDAGIDRAKDLEGKKVATSQYRIVIDIWLRGFLKHHHGVDPSSIKWLSLRDDIFPIHDHKVQIEIAKGDKNPVDRMLDGEVEAIITDISDVKLFNVLENNPKVKRLFPDYVERDYNMYRKTGIYAPMHLIVMSKKLDRDHPELAGKIYQAFEQAKKVAYDDILSDMAGFTVVNLRERMKEQIGRWE